MAKITLSRQQSLRSMINTAISLHFAEGDVASSHVLASAASELSRGLCKGLGIEPFDAIVEKRIKPERIADWRAAANRHYNFLKHADRDAHIAELDFDPDSTSFEIQAAVSDYIQMYKTPTLQMMIFNAWMAVEFSDIFKDDYLKNISAAVSDFRNAFGQSGSARAVAREKIDSISEIDLDTIRTLFGSRADNIDIEGSK